MTGAKKQLAHIVRKDVSELGSYQKLSAKMGISTSTLFRLANEDWQRPGRAIKEAADKYRVPLKEHRNPSECEPVLKAISEIWDGSDSHAKALAGALKSIHNLAIHSYNYPTSS